MDRNNHQTFETAEKLITKNIPIVAPDNSVLEVRKYLGKDSFEEIHTVYVISKDRVLLGQIPISKVFAAKETDKAQNLIEKPQATVAPFTDQEKVVIKVIEKDLKSVPVVDLENHFLGIITAEKIIDILHEEHLEDLLRSSGIRGKGSKIVELINAKLLELVKFRLPWLLAGLLIGFVISLFTSQFEDTLRKNIALVFFIPVITYISDAVGTQTETIFIRAVTLFKINILRYIIKELFVGMIMGSILGIITGIFGFFLSNSFQIGLVVGISLFLSVSTATVLACIIPTILKSLKKDPAVGSGPFTTALQDFVSIFIYLLVTIIVLR